ncbi:MAG: T9SS type A sorting domain-containing protein [Flavipsychrobacter sp.]|nr:T9SS type A sorting domain-containing protein [Flavipsychrobacter sp.]
MKRFFCLLIALLSYATCSYAQNRQVRYDGQGTGYHIYDSKVDSQKNIVSIGGAGYPFIMKTDISGNKLWSRRINTPYLGPLTPLKVEVDASGNYVVLLKYQWPVLVKFSPEGDLLSSKQFTYNSQVNNNTTSFTLLPNGNIAICGFNDFDHNLSSSWIEWMGYLYVIDSTGAPVYLKSFGFTYWIQEYYFYDITSSGNKIYICGKYNNSPLILSTDLDGNNNIERTFPTVDTLDNINYSAINYNKISYTHGALYVGGTMADNNNAHTVQIVGTVDTGTFAFHGAAIAGLRDTNVSSAVFYPSDSSTLFFADQDVASHGRSVLYGKVVSDTLMQARKMISDSLLTISSLVMAADTAIFTGNFHVNNTLDAFLASYNTDAPSTQLTHVVDTQVYFSRFDLSPSTTPDPGIVYRNTPSDSVIQAIDSPCIVELHVCGSDRCKPIPFVQPVPSAEVCFGDTVFLSIGGCFHSTWYRNDTLLPGFSDLLPATKSGTYYFVADNGICYDTSSGSHVTIRPSITPLITRFDDTLKASYGATYQWLDSNFFPIANDTDSVLVFTTPGKYAVKVTDSFGCSAVSSLFNTINVSVAQLSSGHDNVRIYPNPATNKFTIQQENTGTLEVEITDQSGRVIGRFIQNKEVTEYSTSSLHIPAGLYLIKMKNNAAITIKKLVVLD